MVGVSIRQWRGRQTSEQAAPARKPRNRPDRGFEPSPWLDPLWHRARHTLLLATCPHADLTSHAAHWHAGPDLDTLLACAEFHGMTPLLAHHLRPVAAPALRRALGAAQARARRITAARQQVVAALVQACADRDLPLLLLKGAALANSVYPEPTLRPMRDVDVLVNPAHVAALLAVLRAQGFAPAGDVPSAGHHHLPGLVRTCDDVPVHLEVHTRLGLSRSATLPNDALFADSVPCAVDGATARMPSPPHMLWHVAHHGFGMPFTTEATKLIWHADLRALVEVWGGRPGLADTRPMRSVLQQLAATRPRPGASTSVLRDYAGWPRASLSHGTLRARFQAWCATLLPPRFWLGMRHRVPPRPLPLLGTWVLHLRDLLQKAWALRPRP